MTLDELIAEAATDSKIDKTQLDIESLKTPEIVNKYLKELFQTRLNYQSLKIEYEELYLERWMYYTGKADASVYQKEPFDFKLLKADVEKFLSADKKLMELKMKISLREEKIRFLEETIKTMNNRSFTIKNAIDWMRFTNGGH